LQALTKKKEKEKKRKEKKHSKLVDFHVQVPSKEPSSNSQQASALCKLNPKREQYPSAP